MHRARSCWTARSSTSRTKLGSHREALHDSSAASPLRNSPGAVAEQHTHGCGTRSALPHFNVNYRPATRAASELTSFALRFPGGAARRGAAKVPRPVPAACSCTPTCCIAPTTPRSCNTADGMVTSNGSVAELCSNQRGKCLWGRRWVRRASGGERGTRTKRTRLPAGESSSLQTFCVWDWGTTAFSCTW